MCTKTRVQCKDVTRWAGLEINYGNNLNELRAISNVFARHYILFAGVGAHFCPPDHMLRVWKMLPARVRHLFPKPANVCKYLECV